MRIDRGQVEEIAGRVRGMARDEIHERRTSVSVAAGEMGVNRITLSRFVNGAQPDLHTLAAVVAWCGRRVEFPRIDLTQ